MYYLVRNVTTHDFILLIAAPVRVGKTMFWGSI